MVYHDDGTFTISCSIRVNDAEFFAHTFADDPWVLSSSPHDAILLCSYYGTPRGVYCNFSSSLNHLLWSQSRKKEGDKFHFQRYATKVPLSQRLKITKIVAIWIFMPNVFMPFFDVSLQCLKITQSVSFIFFNFWHFPPIFVL